MSDGKDANAEAGYVLGTSDHELERLSLQQEVWGRITAGFLDALGLPAAGRALDVGCGPGHVTAQLRERVGEVVALDESAKWIDHVGARARAEGWNDVEARRGRIQDVELEPAAYDVIFLRWVLAFLPEPEAVLARLVPALKPGGVLAVMDYNHEGVSVFPESAGFRAAIQACRRAYAAHGGDTFLMGRIPGLFRGAGLAPFHLEPHVIAGGPESDAARWMNAFFPFHSEGWVEAGLMSAEDRDLFLREWAQRRADPVALFFSPIVVGAAARKPA